MRVRFGTGRISRREGGFSVIEVVAAFGIFALISTALAFTTISGYRAARDTRFFQQATALGNEAVEELRDLSYSQLVMKTSDAAGDPYRLGSCSGLTGTHFLDPDGTGPMSCETLITVGNGAGVSPHATTETVDGKQYTVRRYVTWVDSTTQGGTGQDYKRISVLVEWQSNESLKSFRTSTLITEARRGLPLPEFDLTPETQSKSVEPGETVVFAHSVRNLGITDVYDLSLSGVPVGRDWTIRFYKDQGEIGVLDGPDVQLTTDTNDTGVLDTGTVITNETVHLLVVWDLPESEPDDSTTVTLTATSGARSTEFRTAADELTVGGAVGLDLSLHNRSTEPTGNTSSTTDMPMDATAPTVSTLYKYSTDLYSAYPGRYVDKSSSGDGTSDKSYMANWVYQVPSQTKLDGQGTLEMWVAMKDLKCDKTPSFTFWVRDRGSLTSHTGTLLATGSATSPASGSEPCNFRKVTANFNINNYTIDTNRYLELKIRNNEASEDAILLAYDTTTYPARVAFPQVSL